MKSNLSNEIVQCIQRIDETCVQRHVETLAGFGPRSIDDPLAVARTLDYLHSELASYGYDVSREPFGDQPHEVNLLASVVGHERPEAVIELGAHYDTVRGSPGADDNASAVAGVLEIARVLCDLVCRRTVRFCLFGAEESGLRGSHAH
ncbi:MAG: M28 family peptidase, partial [Gammaproteobacteria bacterium]|nr:M28 family peptidase [Gammaproteobacteria bacterium]